MDGSVVISGYLLSSLLQECVGSACALEGLLFGEFSTTTRSELTDANEDGIVRSDTLGKRPYSQIRSR